MNFEQFIILLPVISIVLFVVVIIGYAIYIWYDDRID